MSVFSRGRNSGNNSKSGDLFDPAAPATEVVPPVETSEVMASDTEAEASHLDPVDTPAPFEYGSPSQEEAVESFIADSSLIDPDTPLDPGAGAPPAPPSNPFGLGLDDDGETAEIRKYSEAAYLAYAMSMVKGRALPYVNDGLKPVQRRILFAMRQMGLHEGKHMKSARVVGDVLGKYHPHGDSSAYDAGVHIAQEFSLRYPLIDGQGNFGSRDGDNAGAMRYTEMRLAPISELLLSEINMDTVDFVPNYDGSFQEPTLLPARLPFILMNGSFGIAVGMSTNMPSHNIREVTEAAILAIKELSKSDNPGAVSNRTESFFNEVMGIISGPDFPEGGHITSSREDILAAYRTGRGSLRVRCRWEIEHLARGQYRIVVTELPYGVASKTVMAQIEDMANPQPKKGKKSVDQDQINTKQTLLSMLDFCRNESGQQVRIVIEPKSSRINANDLMNFLIAKTDLEVSFSINNTMVGLDGAPRQKGIVEILREWARFRFVTVTRRTQHSYQKTLARIHILEGRMIAFLSIEEVIRVIREAEDPKIELMAQFKLSEIQAEDILEIRLRQLARLEGIRIESELNSLKEEAGRLKELLDNETSLRSLIIKEMRDDMKKFGDDRRTLIEPVERVSVSTAVLTTDEPTTIILSRQGWIRSRQGHEVNLETLSWKPADSLLAILPTRTVNNVIVLDTKGRSYSIPASQIPGGKGDGVPLSSLIDLQEGARVAHVFSGAGEDQFLFAGEQGYGFIAPLASLVSRSKSGKAFMTVEDKETILKPLALPQDYSQMYLSAQSSENRLLVFLLAEMKVLNAGGKGVMVMDLPDGVKMTQVSVHEQPLVVEVTGKRGKPLQLSGDNLQKHILKRARKGALIG